MTSPRIVASVNALIRRDYLSQHIEKLNGSPITCAKFRLMCIVFNEPSVWDIPEIGIGVVNFGVC